VIEKFHAEHWHNYAQPDWNTKTSVADALSSVWEASDSDSSERACNKLLYAVGNNHAGTYYPVLIAVTPFMEEILRIGHPWSVRTVLSILIDLLASFEPARGYERFNDPAGNSQMLANAFKESAHRLRPSVERIAASGEVDAEMAKEVISLMDRP
jgi:hypothetical protein